MRTRTVARILAVAWLVVALSSVGCAGNQEPEPVDGSPAASEPSATSMELTSSAFEEDGEIPVRFARQGIEGGENVSIPLQWGDAPAGTRSYAVLMIDVHPVARKWVHWMAVNIPADVSGLEEGASTSGMPTGAVELLNGWGEAGYGGPEPPAGTGGHVYLTTVYALDVAEVEISRDAGAGEFRSAIDGHVLAEARLEGTLKR